MQITVMLLSIKIILMMMMMIVAAATTPTTTTTTTPTTTTTMMNNIIDYTHTQNCDYKQHQHGLDKSYRKRLQTLLSFYIILVAAALPDRSF